MVIFKVRVTTDIDEYSIPVLSGNKKEVVNETRRQWDLPVDDSISVEGVVTDGH